MTTSNLGTLLKDATNEQLLAALAAQVRRTCPDDATKITVEITHGGHEQFITTTGEGYLRAKGINMRNLRGEWILKEGGA